jgi:hypothetical protein
MALLAEENSRRYEAVARFSWDLITRIFELHQKNRRMFTKDVAIS